MYFSCHNHTEKGSNFRLRDAITRVPDLITYAHDLGLKGVCITEHEAVSSAMAAEKFFDSIKDQEGWEGFILAFGNEIYLCHEDVAEVEPKVFPHFILIALDAEGHRQIRELSTIAWSRAFTYKRMMRVPTFYSDLQAVIGANPGHVIGSSACLGGSLPTYILAHRHERDCWQNCMDWIAWMKDLFGDGNFFLELQPSHNEEQQIVNSALIQLSKWTQTPYIITTDSHYLTKADAKIHEAFLNSQDGDREVAEFYSSTYVMSEEEIHEYLDNNIGYEAVETGLKNTLLIYNRVQHYSLRHPLHIPYCPLNTTEPDQALVNKYDANIPMLKVFAESSVDSDRHLVRAITEALERDESFREQAMYEHLNYCLDTIQKSSEKMNTSWSAYLLQVSDYIKVVWEKADCLVGAARGSGCGFGLLNVLGITQINPLHETTPTYPWRFLNPERASVLDIDIDIESNKRDQVMSAFKEVYGEDRVSKVMTYSTEGSRSAILTMARGMGIDNDLASYIASLVIADRGMQRSLKVMYYGDDENKPVREFINAIDACPGLLEGAMKIEGLCNGVGSHAGGVIFVDEPFINTTALMRTNSGDTITQFDLHEAEDCGLIKIDLLSIEGLDKIRACLDLLLADGRIQWQGSLKATYESVIGINSLERKAPEMWKLLHEHRVLSLFQMEKDSGVQALSLIQPTDIDQLASLNSVIRLMAQEEGGEVPLKKYARFRRDITQWYQEMDRAGLTPDEQDVLKEILASSCGLCIFQEQMMMLVMHPQIGGMSLAFADRCRKAVAKKQAKDFDQVQAEFLDNAKAKGVSDDLARYVWFNLIYTQRSYSFNSAHCLSYSLIALQELNLCYKYPIIYWDCANLLVDSGSLENADKGTNYGKMAVAIANIRKNNIKIELPLINEAQRGFVPDVEHNEIIFSLKAINGVGDTVVDTILAERPYKSLDDFCDRLVVTKKITNSPMISLIKAGCFEALDNEDRKETMKRYLLKYQFTPNTSLTRANLPKMLQYQIIPALLRSELNIYYSKDYLLDEGRLHHEIVNGGKKVPKKGYHDRAFVLDAKGQKFFEKTFSEDSVLAVNESTHSFIISEKLFLKEWESKTAPLVEWLRSSEALEAYNKAQFQELWDKHASGSIASWDMDALSFYYREHELSGLNEAYYGVVNYFDLPEEPQVYDYYFRTIKGQTLKIPKYRIVRLAGTVINADNNHHMITLLTTHGAVNVKYGKGQYAYYNQQISAVDEDSGKKRVLEKPWFQRGTLLLVAGYRQGDVFRAYRYQDTIYQHTAIKINYMTRGGKLNLTGERIKVNERDG